MEKMSRHSVQLIPGGYLPPATHGVLKSLLENPVKLPLHHEGKVTELFTSCWQCDKVPTPFPRGAKCVRGIVAGMSAAER